jgi:RNA polymerase sigma factor (sigma-70 family)
MRLNTLMRESSLARACCRDDARRASFELGPRRFSPRLPERRGATADLLGSRAAGLQPPGAFGQHVIMSTEPTTAAVQRYLDALAGDQPAEPIVRALLDRSARRLHVLCTNLLYRNYRRLTLPPVNLQPDEMLDAVVERLLKAMRSIRPQTVRQFFALVNQHMRWELNDVARRLDEQPAVVEVHEEMVPAPASSGSVLSHDGRRILKAIDDLPEDEREVFGLVHVQGLTQREAGEVLCVSVKTVQRQLNRSLLLLAKQLDDLRPS